MSASRAGLSGKLQTETLPRRAPFEDRIESRRAHLPPPNDEFPRSIESMGTENQRIAGSEYRPCGPFGEGRYRYVPVRRPSPSASQLTLAMLALHACALAQDPNLAVARHEELFNTHRSSILLRRGVLSSASNAAWRRPTASSAPSAARPADRAHSTAAARSEQL